MHLEHARPIHTKKTWLAAGAIGQTTALSLRADWAMKPKASSTQTVRFRRARSIAPAISTDGDQINAGILRRRPQGANIIDKPSTRTTDTRKEGLKEPAPPTNAPSGKTLPVWMTVLFIIMLPLVAPELLMTVVIPFLQGG